MREITSIDDVREWKAILKKWQDIAYNMEHAHAIDRLVREVAAYEFAFGERCSVEDMKELYGRLKEDNHE